MIPITLKISGFLSYQEPAEIDFELFDLACISGGNGAGKSSILDSMTWALFGQARRRDDAVINLQSSQAAVEFSFEFQKNIYRILRVKQRGKPAVLEFSIQLKREVWNPLTERTLRATENKIEETLRLDYETFTNASFFLQGNADQFTQQKSADRKRILGSILGLEVWEKYRSIAVDEKKTLNNSLATIDGRLTEILMELGEEDDRKEKLTQLSSKLKLAGEAITVQESIINAAKTIFVLQDERKRRQEKLSLQVSSLNEKITSATSKKSTRIKEKEEFELLIKTEKRINIRLQEWNKIRENLAEWEKDAKKYLDQESKRHQPLAQIEKAEEILQSEINQLVNQKTEIDSQSDLTSSLEEKQSKIQLEIEKFNQSIQKRKDLEIDKETALKNQFEAQAENPRLRDEMDSLKSRIEQLKVSDGVLCPICDQPLSPDEREKLILNLELEGKEKGDKYRANQMLVKSTIAITDEITAQISQFEEIENLKEEKTRELDLIFIQMEKILEENLRWKTDIAPQLKKLTKQLDTKKFALNDRKILTEIDNQLKEIGYDADQHDKIRASEKEYQIVEKEVLDLEKAKSAHAPIAREIKDVGKQIDGMELELEKLITELEEAKEISSSDEKESLNLTIEEAKQKKMQEEENQLRLEVGGAKQAVDVLKSLKEKKSSLSLDREEVGRKITQYNHLEKAFGKDGIPAMLIEQALPQIQSNANKHLEKLGNGDMRIEFITQQAYKDAKRKDLKETLDIQITDSAGKRDYEMFSGGEGFRINFAIRLALAEVLAQRAGARLELLVIDEGFGSQDQLGRQRLVEVINLIKPQFKKILVITHIESLKDVFPTRIEVTKIAGQGSQIEVI